MNITACILAKNEGHCIGDLLVQLKPFVSSIIVTDDNSTDDTAIIATTNGAKVLTLPFPIAKHGFAEAVNWMEERVDTEWIFEIDADELVGDIQLLHTLTRYPDKNVWAFPRRKWRLFPRIREEYEAYPDWQIRFFRRGSGRFEGQMHKKWVGDRVHFAYNGPHIEHRQTEMRTIAKIKNINKLYPKLANLQGVEIHGGKIREIE